MFGVRPILLTSLVAASARAMFSGCDLTNVTVALPPGQNNVVAPTNLTASFVALAVGVQNYTCSETSTWTTVGAMAQLFDISCFINDPSFLTVQRTAFSAWNSTDGGLTNLMFMSQGANTVLGQHYYIQNAAGALVPKWDFTSAAFNGDSTAFFVGTKIGDIPSPSPSGNATNVDWVSLANAGGTRGNLASQVLRVDTQGGQPPASCSSWDGELSVKFTAKYWFFGGAFNSSSTTPAPVPSN